MSWEYYAGYIVEEFHLKYGHCRGVIWTWIISSPLREIYDQDPETFLSTSNEAWADRLYEWCQIHEFV